MPRDWNAWVLGEYISFSPLLNKGICWSPFIRLPGVCVIDATPFQPQLQPLIGQQAPTCHRRLTNAKFSARNVVGFFFLTFGVIGREDSTTPPRKKAYWLLPMLFVTL